MGNNWTDQQQLAIGAKDHAVIVSAAAGSGKTAVLIEKLLRILSDKDDPVPADRIAVATFTNDAAAQMKQRLADALAAAADSDPDNDWLITQQALVQGAKISTISSFCFGLIRDNISLTDIDPSFRIVEPAEEELITEKAIENVIEEFLDDDGEKYECIKTVSDFFIPGAKSNYRLIELIKELRGNVLSLPFYEDFLKECTERYKNPVSPDDDELIEIYINHVRKQLDTALFLSDRCCETMRKAYLPVSGSDKKSDEKITNTLSILYDENALIRHALAMAETADRFFGSSKEVTFARLTVFDPYKKEFSPESERFAAAKKSCTDDRDAYKDIMKKLTLCFSLDTIREDYAVHGRICEKLFTLLLAAIAEEKKLKNEKNALGFSDAEQTAVSLLCKKDGDTIIKTPLAKELSEYFAIVMIDEFQDSNAIQELIFRMLSKDGSAEKAGSDFFAVGDVKQSIYRFRGADPSIFMKNLEGSVPYENAEGDQSTKILLNRNFRSTEGVIDFVNSLFRVIMSRENGGIDYNDDHALTAGADIKTADGFCDLTEIINLPCTDDADEPDTDEESAEEELTSYSPADVLEARVTAARIRRLIDEEYIPDKNGLRRCVPADICVLMRSTKNVPLFIECLEQAGVPAGGDASDSFLGSREISVMVNMLRMLDNPSLDIPAAAVLMSPMFMFTAEDMARLHTNRKTSVFASIINVCSESSLYTSELVKKCREFIETFEDLRRFAAVNSTEKLIRYIYDKTDFPSAMSVYRDSAKRKANLRLLPIYASEYDRNSFSGLDGFVRRINSMAESGKDFGSASVSAASADGVVSIKTIHKSKGLEYPFVFLCQSAAKFNMTDLNRTFMFNGKYGAAFKITDTEKAAAYTSFPREAFSIEKQKALRDEEMMLFYVALTRAKLKLFITRQNTKKTNDDREKVRKLFTEGDPKQLQAVNKGNSMDMWLEAAMCTDALNGRYILTEGTADAAPDSVYTPESTPDAEKIRENAAILREKMSFRKDHTLAETAAKLTVSELAKKKHTAADSVFGSGQTSLPKGISAAAAGTAVHTFMQFMDAKKLYSAEEGSRKNAVKEECTRLVQNGILTDIQAKCIRPELVLPFFESELCGKMARSAQILREKKFLVKISELSLDDEELLVYNDTEGMLQGVADCLFEESDGWVLIDYKTDRNASDEELIERYSLQLKLYARALSMILDKPVKEAYIYPFRNKKPVKTEI